MSEMCLTRVDKFRGAPCSADCDDKDPKTYPGAPLLAGCARKDVNCDGIIDGICH
jgi:hypothetical protein